jgi:hypothetical protein
MNEQQIRQIVRDEVEKNYRSGAPLVPPHTHDGVNNLKIKQSDIIHLTGIMGKVTFTSNSTYTLYFTAPNPSRLELNGFTYDTGAANSSVLTTGIALLSQAYYFQPRDTRSAKQGGTQYPIDGVLAQCSSNLYVQDSGSALVETWPRVDQFYLLNAYTGASTSIGTIQAQNLTSTSIELVVTNLASGFNIVANFIIT